MTAATRSALRVLAALAPCALAGCSLATYEYAPCTQNEECRDAFGFGWVCGGEGLCAEAEVDPRCERTWPTDLFERRADYREAVVLGAMFDLSDDPPEAYAAELAVRQVNDGAGLAGQAFALVTCTYAEDDTLDGLDKPEAAAHVTDYLANALGTPAIVGPGTSSTAEIAYEVAGPAGTVLISPSATSPYLTTIDGSSKTDEDPGLFWRTAPPDTVQGAVIARDMAERLVDTVAVVYQDGSYGKALANAFVEAFVATGGVVTLHPFASESDRATAVHAARGEEPEEFFLIASTTADLIGLLSALSVAGELDDVGIFLTDTARNETFLEDATARAPELLPHIRGTAPALPEGEVYESFLTAWANVYGSDTAASSVYMAHAWDAAWLALLGVAWADANEDDVHGVGIARGLRKVSEERRVDEELDLGPATWEAARAAFSAGEGIDVNGASGQLDYDPVTEETSAPVEVWSIRDGAFFSEYTFK